MKGQNHMIANLLKYGRHRSEDDFHLLFIQERSSLLGRILRLRRYLGDALQNRDVVALRVDELVKDLIREK